jgi:hypothetical protein
MFLVNLIPIQNFFGGVRSADQRETDEHAKHEPDIFLKLFLYNPKNFFSITDIRIGYLKSELPSRKFFLVTFNFYPNIAWFKCSTLIFVMLICRYALMHPF